MCKGPAALRKTLRTLPKTLDETYERILLRIYNSPDRDYAKCILLWLAFSLRPLTVEEVAETLAFSYDSKLCFEENDRLPDPSDVMRICPSLVNPVRNNDNPVLQLAHFSVKEYLVATRIQEGHASFFYLDAKLSHDIIAQCCLVYLMQCYASKCGGFPLVRYAVTQWIRHTLEMSEMSKALCATISSLSVNDAWNMYSGWWLFEWQPENVAVMAQTSLIHCAAWHGSSSILDLLIKNGVDVNTQGGTRGNALHMAAFGGFDTVVQLLLENGADVNAEGGKFGSALQAASFCGHETIVHQLLVRDADVNVQGGYYGSALPYSPPCAFTSAPFSSNNSTITI